MRPPAAIFLPLWRALQGAAEAAWLEGPGGPGAGEAAKHQLAQQLHAVRSLLKVQARDQGSGGT